MLGCGRRLLRGQSSTGRAIVDAHQGNLHFTREKDAPACAPHPETVETRRARGFFADERGRDDRRNLRPPGREIVRILRAAAERENGVRPLHRRTLL